MSMYLTVISFGAVSGRRERIPAIRDFPEMAGNLTAIFVPQHQATTNATGTTKGRNVSNRAHTNISATSAQNRKNTQDICATQTSLQLSSSRAGIKVNPLPNSIVSYVNIEKLRSLSVGHPNKNICKYIFEGLENGFRIGYSGTVSNTRPENLLSARKNSIQVSEAIHKELERGHTSGPFEQPPFEPLHCSPIGAVMKKDGSCRLVMDLSQPSGSSINEGILKEDFSVQYSKFDDAIKLVWSAGRGCYMCKVDIKHAFRLLPVDPADWNLLGYRWNGCFFVDTRLSFGSRSSPKIFNDFADLVCWILQNKYGLRMLIHYSDDFFLVCGHCYELAKRQLVTLCQAFEEMGIPLAVEKIVGPVTCIEFLGTGIDSLAMTMFVTEEKYESAMASLSNWSNRRSCTKQQILSLIGTLSYICKVVQPGRIFLRRLINLSTTVDKLHHHVTLNKEANADISWWLEFLPQWSRRTLIPESFSLSSDDLYLYTDASKYGFGAIFGSRWIQGEFDTISANHSIDFKELFAIVARIALKNTSGGRGGLGCNNNPTLNQVGFNENRIRMMKNVVNFTGNSSGRQGKRGRSCKRIPNYRKDNYACNQASLRILFSSR